MGARRPLVMLCVGLAVLGGAAGRLWAQTAAPAAGPKAGKVSTLIGQATVTRAAGVKMRTPLKVFPITLRA